MASVADLDLALLRASLAAFGDISPRDGYPTLDAWRRLTCHLDSAEADRLPAALSATVPALAVNAERFRVLLGILASFDIYEATSNLVEVVMRDRNLDAAVAAARLASSPGVQNDMTGRLIEATRSAGWEPNDIAAVVIRLLPDAEAPTALLGRLQMQSWPGLAA